MIYGRALFRRKNRHKIFSNILNKDLTFPSSMLVSLAPKKLIHSFLNRDPASRLGSNGDTSEIKGYPFFRGITWPLLRCMLHVQSTLMLEQEVVQPVGAL